MLPPQPFFLEKPLQKCGLGFSLSVELTSVFTSYAARDGRFCHVGVFSAMSATEIHHPGFRKLPNPHQPSGQLGHGLDANRQRLHIVHY